MDQRRKIGELLVERGLISHAQLQDALDKQQEFGVRIGSALVKMGVLQESVLLNFLSMYFDVPKIDLRQVKVSRAALRLVDPDYARKYGIVPLKIRQDPMGRDILAIATTDPINFEVLQKLQDSSGMRLEVYVTTHGALLDFISGCYCQAPSLNLDRQAPDKLVKALANLLIDKGIFSEEDLATYLNSTDSSQKDSGEEKT